MSDLDFLAALKSDTEGRTKLVASESFPDTERIDVAEGDVNNQLRGERRLKVATLLAATADPERIAAVTYLAKRVGYRLERERRDPFETLDRVAGQLDLLLNQAQTLKSDMDDTREMLAEIRAPKRVEPRSDAKGRARA